MNIHEKIQMLLKKKGRGSQKELAGILGEDKTYLNKWVNGIKPVPQQHLLGTALFLGVTVDYLMDDNQEIPLIKHVPLIGEASCGVPVNGFYGDGDVEYVPATSDIYLDTAYAVKADGDSMLPTISHGEIVYCDTGKPPSDNTIVHYTFDGDSGIKRIRRQKDGSIMLLPDNHDYSPIIIPKERTEDILLARCTKVFKNI